MKKFSFALFIAVVLFTFAVIFYLPYYVFNKCCSVAVSISFDSSSCLFYFIVN